MKSVICHRRRGVTAVESAVVLSSVLVLVFGAFEIGVMTLRQSALSEAARLGARAAIVRGADSSLETVGPDPILCNAEASNPIANACRRMLPTMSPQEVTIEVEWPEGNELDDEVKVTISYPHRFTIPIIGAKSELVLESQSRMIISR